MENPTRTHLKIKEFTNPEKSFITQRYVIETVADLRLTLESFPQLSKNAHNVAEDWEKALIEGRIILVTDEHPVSGYPTYCFESPQGSTHTNSLIRV